MSESILSSKAGIFPCYSCGQMIYSDVEKCRFCSAIVDRQAAAQGADLQSRVNAACNQAKLLRGSAGAMWIFFLLGLLFMPFGWAFTGLFFVIPVWLISWQLKFGGLQTSDPDYKRARHERLLALIIWLPALAIELLSFAVRVLIR